ncbi:helix-turn-helix domain-containing protein [Thermococcus sp. AM4]|uniref:MarR family transcriptional regulator n=1 Tax=Thermococcus sp. (strain AM4) TaxID=246969 RepID=UPI0001871068|nr:helix-turn-helix domain-containing protein [Thermococcus sp. AM4]EEB73165.1 LexA-related DNA-binding protein [Thermococcus sp. AM4]
MGKLEEVLRLINEGKRFPQDIARELGITVGEVEGIIELLKGLGYIEEVEKGPACETCPLRKVCYGKCLLPKVKVLRPSFDLRED